MYQINNISLFLGIALNIGSGDGLLKPINEFNPIFPIISYLYEQDSTDKIDVDMFLADSSYQSKVIHSFSVLKENPADETKTNQLIQLLSSDALTDDNRYKLANIAAKYKVCSVSPALIKLLGKQTSLIIEPQLGKTSPDEALIVIGDCAHPHLKEYLIKGSDFSVKNILAQIMRHYINSDRELVDSLESIMTECEIKENVWHIERIIQRIEDRMNQ